MRTTSGILGALAELLVLAAGAAALLLAAGSAW
jgi:hypothetical protein